jgi:hypothetical protein
MRVFGRDRLAVAFLYCTGLGHYMFNVLQIVLGPQELKLLGRPRVQFW